MQKTRDPSPYSLAIDSSFRIRSGDRSSRPAVLAAHALDQVGLRVVLSIGYQHPFAVQIHAVRRLGSRDKGIAPRAALYARRSRSAGARE